MIACAWILPIVLSAPKYVEKGVQFKPGDGNETGYVCYSYVNGTKKVFTDYQWYSNMFQDWSIIIIIIIATAIIFWDIKKKEEQLGKKFVTGEIPTSNSDMMDKMRAARNKLTLTLTLICAIYISFRFPLVIAGHFVEVVRDTAVNICLLIYQLQFCLNILVYAFVQQDYQNAYIDFLRKMLPCCFKCQTNDETVDN